MGKTSFFIAEILTWQALLDIILIAAAIFFLYRTLLRLGTWKILAGILLALAVFVFANVLNLEGIEWIYQNVSHVAVLGLIILFQPELRKVFEKAVSVSPVMFQRGDDLLAKTIAESLWKLAEQRHGALVVFPGREPIRDKLSGGYLLGASPSVPLILSIFDPHSPGHDGAVIILDNRMSSFGVRLPMSQSNRLPEEYGTRHHAAMGLAEQTDALTLVVSEERGKVSAFVDGLVKPMADADEIVRAIQNHRQKLGFFQASRNPIRKRTLFQAAASLVIALIFWSTLVVGQREVIERVISVPIEYSSPTNNLVLVGEKATEVKLHLVGSKSALDSPGLTELGVKVDLSRMREGKQVVAISEDNLRLPRGVTLLDTVPQQLELSLSTMIERTMRISPQMVGKLPEGFKLKKISVTPEQIQVKAPASGIKEVDTLITTPVYLSSITADATLFCKIISPPTVQPVVKTWPDVEVQIELKKVKK